MQFQLGNWNSNFVEHHGRFANSCGCLCRERQGEVTSTITSLLLSNSTINFFYSAIYIENCKNDFFKIIIIAEFH